MRTKAGKWVRAVACASVTGLGLMCVPLAAQDSAAGLAMKRLYFSQVNARCHLLTDEAALSLKGSFVQARNQALRQGENWQTLGPAFAQVRRAAARTDCANPAMLSEAATVQNGFARFTSQARLTLEGGRGQWEADRGYPQDIKWRLVQYQSSVEGEAALGVRGTLGHGTLSVMAAFKDGAKPYAARLMVRNPARLSKAVLVPAHTGIGSQGPLGGDQASLSFHARDTHSVQTVMTSSNRTNMAGFTLTGEYEGTQAKVDAIRFDFPLRAAVDIARLDPREDIVVAFDFSDGTRYARFESGDFVAGLVFIALPARTTF